MCVCVKHVFDTVVAVPSEQRWTLRDDVRHERGKVREIVSGGGGSATAAAAAATASGKGRNKSRIVARDECRGQGQVHVKTLYGRADAGLLHRVQRAGVASHAKPKPPEGVPGEPAAGQQHVRSVGEPGCRQLYARRRGDRAGASGRYDHLEDDCAEQYPVRTDHIHWILERPKPQAQTVHAHTDHRRVPHQYRAACLHVLLLRAAHGGGWPRRVRATSHHRRLDDYVHGRVQLRGRRDHGKCNGAVSCTPCDTGRVKNRSCTRLRVK